MLDTIEQEYGSTITTSVIWLHGLGADGSDFAPVPPLLGLPPELGVRFIFPHAPQQAVTINAGMVMRAWFDILSLDFTAPQDETGIRASADLIIELIKRENSRGIATSRIVLAGFSQGGAIALFTALRYPERLAGVAALSTFLPLADTTLTEVHTENADVPIFMAHGQHDAVLPLQLGQMSKDRLLAAGYPLVWHEYPMEHSVSPHELEDIGQWLSGLLYLG